jgi:hypothetical protein
MKILIISGISLCFILLTTVTSGTVPESGWSVVTSDAGFSPRYDQGTVVFNGRIWVIGGDSVNGSFNDVWSSLDGKNWTLETKHAGFSPRFGQGTAVFNDKLWVIGGLSEGTPVNDVWSSFNGKNWTLETKHAGFSPRFGQGTVVFNDKLWVIGGSGTLNDIWSSSDGSNWTLETNNADFISRQCAGVAVFDHRIWVIGGYTYSVNSRGDVSLGALNDVWSSGDGITWKSENSSAAFGPRELDPVAVYDNKIWILGGEQHEPHMSPKTVDITRYDYIWSSNDGINWTPEPGTPGFLPRHGNGAVVFNDTLWIIGGRNPYDENDVWSYRVPNFILTAKNGTITPQISKDFNETILPVMENRNGTLPISPQSSLDPIFLISSIFMIFGILGALRRET